MKQILYIENDHSNFNLIARYLYDLPVRLTQAETAEQALYLLKQRAFNLVLIDVQLPDVGLHSFSQKLYRPVSRITTAPIIIITAYARADHHELLAQLQPAAHFTKPVPMQPFRQAVKGQLNL